MDTPTPLHCAHCRSIFLSARTLLYHIPICPQFTQVPLYSGIQCGDCSSILPNLWRMRYHIMRQHVQLRPNSSASNASSDRMSTTPSPSPPEFGPDSDDGASIGHNPDAVVPAGSQTLLGPLSQCVDPSGSPATLSQHMYSSPPCSEFDDDELRFDEPIDVEGGFEDFDDIPLLQTPADQVLSNEGIAGQLTHELAAIAAKSLEYTGMTEKTVQFYMERFMHYQRTVYSVGLEDLYRRLSEEGAHRCCELTLRRYLDQVKAVLDAAHKPVRSTHTRLGYFIQQGTYILPRKVLVVNETPATQMIVVGQDVPAKPSDSQVMFVPLRLVLKKLFEIPGFFEAVRGWEKVCRNSPEVSCFIESETWLKHAREREHGGDGSYFYPIHLYYDDFEAGNALGSHASKRKLGGVYYSLPFLPPHLSSKLKFIMLALVFKSKVRETIGNKAVFAPVIEELMFLYQHGITVNLPNRQSLVIKFGLGCLVGDNLGMNAMLGFTQGFRSLRCCRLCRITKHEYSTTTVEDPSLLRTKANHLEDIASEDKTTGVVEKCVWYQLPYFSIDAHTSVDMMHDIFEGVGRYVMLVVLKGLVSRNKVLDLNYLNDRIKNLAYGPDSGSKPMPISAPKAFTFTMRMSSSEMRNFIAYFGLMVGHLMTSVDDYDPPCIPHGRECSCHADKQPPTPDCDTFKTPVQPPLKCRGSSSKQQSNEDVYRVTPYIDMSEEMRRERGADDSEEFYKLYLMLNRVVILISNRTASPARAEFLRYAIDELLSLYLRVSRKLDPTDSEDQNLQPKFHFLTHYPTMTLRHGPLTDLSSMRFESKNKDVKTTLKNSWNNVNTPFSAAKKVQYHFNSLLFENCLPSELNEGGKPTPIPPNDLIELAYSLGIEADPSNLKSIKTVRTGDSVTFVPGYIVLLDIDNEGEPEFVKISNLYINLSNNEVYFKGEHMSIVEFSVCYQAYEVQLLGSVSYYNLSQRLYPFPNTFVTALNGLDYVRLRNSL